MRALRTASMGAKTGLVGILLLWCISAFGVDIKRPKDPVVVTGGQLALYLGAPPNELFVYSFKNGVWQQICFQIDEKTGGSYFGGTNGQWDAGDEICFMAADVGDSAANHQWIENAVSLTHQRYQIKVTNPATSPAKTGYAYIYRSSTLAVDGSVADYMYYSPAPGGASNDTVKAKGYTLGHNSDAIADYLVLKNGGNASIDILDRWKIRYHGQYYGIPSFVYDDDEISALSDSVMAVKNGRIRVIRKELIQGSMGSVVSILDSLIMGSSKETYYKDDATPDMRDTGDGASFGDSGVLVADAVNKLSGALLYKTHNFYLGDPHTTAIADSVAQLLSMPVQVAVMAREFVIPVELASFSAQVRANGVELLWSTATESDNYGFEVQRFNSADHSWSKIGWVRGAGTVVDAQHYRFFDQLDAPGEYQYRLKQIDFDGASALTMAVSATIQAPNSLVLWPSYPNPFNPETRIGFTLPTAAAGAVRISIFNMLGQEIKVLFDGALPAGSHFYRWDGTDHQGRNSAGGVYLCRLQTSQGVKLQKMVKML